MADSREVLEVDILLVGAGPASLAAAYQIMKRAKDDGRTACGEHSRTGLQVSILEKGRQVGNIIFSGAVMDPRGIAELIPDWQKKGAPVESPVTGDAVYVLTQGSALRFPITPPPLRQHGNYVVSLCKFTRWLADQVTPQGVNIFTGFAAASLLYEGDRVVGVRMGDKGIDKNGNRKPNFEPGVDIRAKITILGEGVRGSLTRDHIWKLKLDAKSNPPSFATGVKEVWEIPPGRFAKGEVIHTMGYPRLRGGIGGGWIYGMDGNLVSIGHVDWLAYSDPLTNPHEDFQRFKNHPFVRVILEGGKMVQYGAKAVSVGGLHTIPQMYSDGCLLIGESANLVDGLKLKGIHLAIKSGMMAGDVAYDALKKGDTSAAFLAAYEEAFRRSWAYLELARSRNFHQAFESGPLVGAARTALQALLGGRDILGDRIGNKPDVAHMKKLKDYYDAVLQPTEPLKVDNRYLFDKLTAIYNAGSIHEEDQPSHLRVADTQVCVERCASEYGNPCTHFCPAQVYEMNGDGAKRRLKLNPSNCVHCKTCDLMDPYDNIRWVVPEGGGGPQYTVL